MGWRGLHQKGRPGAGLGRAAKRRWHVVGWGWWPGTGMAERPQMTSSSPSWANFRQFHGSGEEVVSDEGRISPAYSSWWHQVAQEGKGFACHPHRSGFKWVASHCCDESVGLSPHGTGLCHRAGASCSPRARQQGCGSQEPESKELSQHLGCSGGPGCLGAAGPHHPRSGAGRCGGAGLGGDPQWGSAGRGGGRAGCCPGARPR